MALPKQYLTSTKNLPDILATLQTAQAPKKFTRSFLEQLDFKSSSDRLVTGVLKGLGFLTDAGEPTERYFEFLDQTRSEKVMAEAIREAYADLFQLNVNAHEMSRSDVKNKFRTLTKGEVSDSVLDKMALTFAALVEQADFSAPAKKAAAKAKVTGPKAKAPIEAQPERSMAAATAADGEPIPGQPGTIAFDGLVYNINIVLPESRDPGVYDALFRALREHLGT